MSTQGVGGKKKPKFCQRILQMTPYMNAIGKLQDYNYYRIFSNSV